MRQTAIVLPFLLLACGEGTEEPQARPEAEPRMQAEAPAPETTSDAQAPAMAEAEPPRDLPDGVAAITDDGVTFRFASREEGAGVLTANDFYTENLQPRETGIRAQDASVTSFDGVAPLYAEDVQAWTPGEIEAIRAAIAPHMDRLDAIDMALPQDVLLVKTGTVVEGGLPHTRANAIIFAGGGLPDGEGLEELFLHELHHVLSRNNRDEYDTYFNLIGFMPCRFEEPEALRETRLTNPDAPVYNHYAPVLLEGADGVIPYLYATGGYSGEGRLPNYFGFGLMPVQFEDGVCTTDVTMTEELLSPEIVPQYNEMIGGNTGYIIHPEETLADNFVYWAMETPDEELESPEVPEAVGAFWEGLAP